MTPVEVNQDEARIRLVNAVIAAAQAGERLPIGIRVAIHRLLSVLGHPTPHLISPAARANLISEKGYSGAAIAAGVQQDRDDIWKFIEATWAQRFGVPSPDTIGEEFLRDVWAALLRKPRPLERIRGAQND